MRQIARGNVLTCTLLLAGIALTQWLLAPPKRAACPYGHHFHSGKPDDREYGRRVRTQFTFIVRGIVTQNAELIRKVRAGDYRGHPEEFQADTSAFKNALLDSMEQFRSQSVPEIFCRAHSAAEDCHRLCYESTQTLQQAYRSRGAERERLLKEAEIKSQHARHRASTGVKLYINGWNQEAWPTLHRSPHGIVPVK